MSILGSLLMPVVRPPRRQHGLEARVTVFGQIRATLSCQVLRMDFESIEQRDPRPFEVPLDDHRTCDG